MLKKRDLHEVPALFDLMSHPEVFPYVRHKAKTSDEFYFITKQTIEAEERGELISRTIMDEQYQPIGTINLFDIINNTGFLATWIGTPYFGKGYNKIAKAQFFNELFSETTINNVLLKIRNTNIRSQKAIQKFPYVKHANSRFPVQYKEINRGPFQYELYVITREHYLAYQDTNDFFTTTLTAT